MKILVAIGSKVSFNECPAELFDFDGGPVGTINQIDVHSNTVSVDVPSWGEILFSLDGSAWSDCCRFKREIPFVSWEC